MTIQYGIEQSRPQVVIWFKVYCGLMAALYAIFALLGVVFLVAGPNMQQQPGEPPAWVMGTIFLVMGAVFTTPFLMGIFLPRRSWVWIFDLVLICIGFTSICTLPFCIWMLIYWLKDPAKMWFGRPVAAPMGFPVGGYPPQQPAQYPNQYPPR